jgi:hypothetical protein
VAWQQDEGTALVSGTAGGAFGGDGGEVVGAGLPEQDPALVIYVQAVWRGGLRRSTGAKEVELPPEVAEAAIERLVELGLLRPNSADAEQLVPVSPEIASAEHLAPARRDLDLRQQSLARMMAEFDSFLPAYLRGMRDRQERQGFELLVDPASIRTLLNREAAACRHEVLAVQPGGPRRPEALVDAVNRDYELLRRGVRMRTLYQHTARFSPTTLEHVRAMTALGAEVRTIDWLPPRLIVFDRSAAVIPDHADGRSAVVVRQRSMIEWLVANFEVMWLAADPLAPGEERDASNRVSADIDRTIVRLLVSGAKDEVIARKLGISLRTCRRRIRLVMDELGAESRFQAGYLTAAAEPGDGSPRGADV